jgi:diketogulonate reductase-like aldo/keto reductase
MLKRTIPSSGEPLPVIGLGTWQQFDIDNTDPEKENLVAVLQTMVDKGATLIDSSPMYGKAEAMVGQLTANANVNHFFYATKVWTSGRENGIEQMQSSFTKMKRDVMDLMQVHNLVDYKTHLKTLRGWKEEGKIRYFGVTHYQSSSHATLADVIKSEKPDFVQFNYSMADTNAEKNLLKTAADHGVAVIINEPFEKGSLFQRVKGKPLPAWAAEWDINSWGQFFLKYILSHPAVTCVIPGTSNPKHALDNILAGYGKLPDEATRKKMLAVLE